MILYTCKQFYQRYYQKVSNLTLKGRKNHYNVKLLRGYGVSITLKDNKISLRNGTDLFGHAEKEEYFVARMPYEKIVFRHRIAELIRILL